jgi:hypothetical protein
LPLRQPLTRVARFPADRNNGEEFTDGAAPFQIDPISMRDGQWGKRKIWQTHVRSADRKKPFLLAAGL